MNSSPKDLLLPITSYIVKLCQSINLINIIKIVSNEDIDVFKKYFKTFKKKYLYI